jgi:hypothetical protein
MVVPIQVTFDCADPDRLAHGGRQVDGLHLARPVLRHGCRERGHIAGGQIRPV